MNNMNNTKLDNLRLVKVGQTKDFPCDYYTNSQNEIFLTRKQLGEALGYKEPNDSMNKIHARYKDMLQGKYIIHKIESSDNKFYEAYLYNLPGIMTICRASKQKQADRFMDWLYEGVLKCCDKYSLISFLTHQNNPNNQYELLEQQIETLTQENQSLLKEIDLIKKQITVLQRTQTRLEISTPKQTYSAWSSLMFPKYQLLLNYFKMDSYKELYKELYTEFSNLYPNINLNQLMKEYCLVHGVDRCFTTNAIEDNAEVKELFENMVDNLLEKYHLTEAQTIKKKTIFDKKVKSSKKKDRDCNN